MADPQVAFYEFGDFRIDMQRYLLLREHEPVQLSPKALKTLLVLIQNRDRVVKKGELLNTIWPDCHVEESNLAQNVFVIRKALGESNEQRYILTVAGAGYRFIAPVTESLVPEATPARAESLRPIARAGIPGRLIAVLPLKSLDRGETDEYLGLGLADALIMRLSSLSKVGVRPTSSVLRYREFGDDPIAVGKQLNVELLLDGVFQRSDDRIRVSVQLIRVSDGMTLWATKFDEHYTNLFAIEDSIAAQVARALELELSAEEQQHLRRSSPGSIEAHHLYIKGRYFWNQRTLEGLKKCLDYAQQTIALDPTYAPAYLGIADSYNLLSGHGGLAPKDTFPKAKAAALTALELDSGLAEAYASLGFLNYRFEWKWQQAEENFRRAIRIKPNYSTAHHWYGEALATAGRFEESLAALERAEHLDPLSLPINTDLGQTLYFARRYEECEKHLRKTLEMDSHFIRAHIILGAALEQLGKYEDAISSLTQAVTLSKRNSFAVSGLAHVHAVMGNAPAAKDALRYLEGLSNERYSSPYNRALIHAGLGNKDEALSLLELAVDERDVWLVWLDVNPRFDGLRSEPRFQNLLSAVRDGQKSGNLALAGTDA